MKRVDAIGMTDESLIAITMTGSLERDEAHVALASDHLHSGTGGFGIRAECGSCGSAALTPRSIYAVAARCGQPTQIEHQAIYGETATAVGPAATPLGVLPPLGVRAGAETRLEVWTYNFGPSRLMQRIRFENGVVVKVESLGYGF